MEEIDRTSDDYNNDFLNYSSYFYQDKALFGSYPTQRQVNILQASGVKVFVNLTEEIENLPDYDVKNLKLNYQIPDRKVPNNFKRFSGFIIYVSRIIKNLKNNKIYIHCRGGHGRAGLVVSCILSYLDGLTSYTALELTNKYHNNRKIMRDCWRKIGSPQTREQHNFVKKLCGFFYFSKAYPYGRTAGLSVFSEHPITLPDLGRFPTSEAAFQAFRNPNDEEYLEKQRTSINAHRARIIGESYKDTCENWDKEKDDIMFTIINEKVKQNFIVRCNLESTFLKYIVFKNKDVYWGCDNETGCNRLGEILMKVKEESLIQNYLKSL